jgi:biofilm PGA synthesis N-glycosyltransferase PgaC
MSTSPDPSGAGVAVLASSTAKHPKTVASSRDSRRRVPVTVLIPAYNEAAFIGDTIRSVLEQSVDVDDVIVVDDRSTDGTGDVARKFGVRVVRPESNSGSKAGALNFGLQSVQSTFTLAIDADTILAPDAIERLVAAADVADLKVAGACGYVVPRRVKSLWERGRYIEYLFAFTIYKPIQDDYENPMIASGCFSMYRTDVLRELKGWPSRALAEDMDLA